MNHPMERGGGREKREEKNCHSRRRKRGKEGGKKLPQPEKEEQGLLMLPGTCTGFVCVYIRGGVRMDGVIKKENEEEC
jgi:hypothetical protein